MVAEKIIDVRITQKRSDSYPRLLSLCSWLGPCVHLADPRLYSFHLAQDNYQLKMVGKARLLLLISTFGITGHSLHCKCVCVKYTRFQLTATKVHLLLEAKG